MDRLVVHALGWGGESCFYQMRVGQLSLCSQVLPLPLGASHASAGMHHTKAFPMQWTLEGTRVGEGGGRSLCTRMVQTNFSFSKLHFCPRHYLGPWWVAPTPRMGAGRPEPSLAVCGF